MNAFKARLNTVDKDIQCRGKLRILQVNLGDLCNQNCLHCHVNAGPEGKNIMSRETVDDVLGFLSKDKDLALDITGGAPEMNPEFRYFVTSAGKIADHIIVRSNLTVMSEAGMEDLPDFYANNDVHLICSLPCYTSENVDKQRGGGVFKKSIKALRTLNEKGYGKGKGLSLDLVYNPGGAFLPVSQEALEGDYKKRLAEEQDIVFDRLVTITNVPVNRFKEHLEKNDEYNEYMGLLEDNFNKDVAGSIMCRTLLSVGWDGTVYDCDFNQAEGMALANDAEIPLKIKDLDPADLEKKQIIFGDHCFSCTAGSGSSCQGALKGSGPEKTEKNCCVSAGGRDGLEKTREMVTEYYGEVLDGTGDLKTGSCCSIENVPAHIREISERLEREITEKFYGCGSPIPLGLEGTTVVDLGCGTGKDTYVIAALAGNGGRVIGLDMTDKQLEVATRNRAKQMKIFGLPEENIEFVKGYIEDLKSAGIKDGTVDIVVSNCVVNLSPRKDLVLAEVYRVLKPGGEFFFSDVFTDRRLPEWAKEDPVLVGECLGGALYWKDLERLAAKAGFLDVRMYSRRPVRLGDAEIEKKVGTVNFFSITCRMFKIDGLEDSCEDYGQKAKYKGGIEYSPDEFILDKEHIFKKGYDLPVCRNSAEMLSKSRFGKHFDITGDTSVHRGLFSGCGDSKVTEDGDGTSSAPGACCG